MYSIREFLWTKETYPIKDMGNFLPNIVGYLHDDDLVRPTMLVVPGGGYFVVSTTEAQIVADKFFAAGYQTFVLTYTVNCGDMRNFLNLPLEPLKNQPLMDISRAVSCIRAHAGEWRVDTNHVAACGFSAGSHLVGSLAVHHHEDFLQNDPFGHSNRPDAVILSYPVITADSRYWHEGSIKSLAGFDAQTPEDFQFYSLEKHVSANTPPAFLWHTITDDAVPVENSLMFMQACRAADVPCELHLFPEGPHGLSTADMRWQNADFGEDSNLCMEPFYSLLKATASANPDKVPPVAAPLLANDLSYFVSNWDRIYDEYRQMSFPFTRQKDDAVAEWPNLAMRFLKRFGF